MTRRKAPNLVQQARTLGKAALKWERAGRPVRTPEQIRELFEKHCRPCEFFEPHRSRKDRGRCLLCGCKVNLQSLNKLKWATEQCPDDPPRWLATVDEQGNPIEHPEPPPELTARERRAKRRQAKRARRRLAKRRARALRAKFSTVTRHSVSPSMDSYRREPANPNDAYHGQGFVP